MQGSVGGEATGEASLPGQSPLDPTLSARPLLAPACFPSFYLPRNLE